MVVLEADSEVRRHLRLDRHVALEGIGANAGSKRGVLLRKAREGKAGKGERLVGSASVAGRM